MDGITFKPEGSLSQVSPHLLEPINGYEQVIGFWRLEDKIGMPLEEIHFSGLVPQCE